MQNKIKEDNVMREIKFRAWIKEYEMMIEPDNINIDFSNKEIRYAFDCYSFDEIVLMQYIGLNDENKTEIYDGDIVELCVFDYNGLDTLYICKVEIDQYGGAWFVDMKNNDNQWLLSECNIVEDDIVVIGNIYENPELLEAENEKDS